MTEDGQDGSKEVVDAVSHALSEFGLDLVQPFDAARYNEHIAQHRSLAPLSLFARERGALGLLIGNTRLLWPRFLEAFRDRADLQASADPLDRYVTRGVHASVSQISQQTLVYVGHEGGRQLVSMLHLAQASGLAHTGPVHLAVHQTHGLWLGLRAVVVVDVDPPAKPPHAAPDLCADCDAPCRRALDLALLDSSWRSFLAVRDACPVGRESRYDEDQIVYHYTKDRSVLSRETGPVDESPEAS